METVDFYNKRDTLDSSTCVDKPDMIYSSLNGLQANARRIDHNAHNVANSNTTGYRATHGTRQTNRATEATVLSTAPGPHVSQPGFAQLAIEGNGYFVFEEDGGMYVYSRNGNLGVNAQGYLVNERGQRLQPAVQLPQDAQSISISRDGAVTATMPDGSTEQVGQLQLAAFNNPGGLQGLGLGMFAATVASGEPHAGQPTTGGRGAIVSGALEGSNTDLAGESVELVVHRSGVAANANVIRARDEMLGTAVDLLG